MLTLLGFLRCKHTTIANNAVISKNSCRLGDDTNAKTKNCESTHGTKSYVQAQKNVLQDIKHTLNLQNALQTEKRCKTQKKTDGNQKNTYEQKTQH